MRDPAGTHRAGDALGRACTDHVGPTSSQTRSSGIDACGVRGEDLIVRLAADAVESVQGEPGVRPFDLTGRPMKGWLLVAADGHTEDDDLRRWVDRGVAYATSLPPKAP
jgi:hypothetical protein